MTGQGADRELLDARQKLVKDNPKLAESFDRFLEDLKKYKRDTDKKARGKQRTQNATFKTG